jgi:hypothetical protein
MRAGDSVGRESAGLGRLLRAKIKMARMFGRFGGWK